MTWMLNTPSLKPVNDEGTLYETSAREIWQCQVRTDDGAVIGHAVRQIIEPRACAVRYLIVFDACHGRRLLVPAVLVSGAEPGVILCSITSEETGRLVEYNERVTREVEMLAHGDLGHRPYWEEEDPGPSSCDH